LGLKSQSPKDDIYRSYITNTPVGRSSMGEGLENRKLQVQANKSAKNNKHKYGKVLPHVII